MSVMRGGIYILVKGNIDGNTVTLLVIYAPQEIIVPFSGKKEKETML